MAKNVAASALPPGFVLDENASFIPEGFVLDMPATPAPAEAYTARDRLSQFSRGVGKGLNNISNAIETVKEWGPQKIIKSPFAAENPNTAAFAATGSRLVGEAAHIMTISALMPELGTEYISSAVAKYGGQSLLNAIKKHGAPTVAKMLGETASTIPAAVKLGVGYGATLPAETGAERLINAAENAVIFPALNMVTGGVSVLGAGIQDLTGKSHIRDFINTKWGGKIPETPISTPVEAVGAQETPALPKQPEPVDLLTQGKPEAASIPEGFVLDVPGSSIRRGGDMGGFFSAEGVTPLDLIRRRGGISTKELLKQDFKEALGRAGLNKRTFNPLNFMRKDGMPLDNARELINNYLPEGQQVQTVADLLAYLEEHGNRPMGEPQINEVRVNDAAGTYYERQAKDAFFDYNVDNPDSLIGQEAGVRGLADRRPKQQEILGSEGVGGKGSQRGLFDAPLSVDAEKSASVKAELDRKAAEVKGGGGEPPSDVQVPTPDIAEVEPLTKSAEPVVDKPVEREAIQAEELAFNSSMGKEPSWASFGAEERKRFYNPDIIRKTGDHEIWDFDENKWWKFSTEQQEQAFRRSNPYAALSENPGGKEKIWYRYGSIPPTGRSVNYLENRNEPGVSVYATPDVSSFFSDATQYTGKGRQIGWGSDGEPNIIPTGKWEKLPKPKSNATDIRSPKKPRQQEMLGTGDKKNEKQMDAFSVKLSVDTEKSRGLKPGDKVELRTSPPAEGRTGTVIETENGLRVMPVVQDLSAATWDVPLKEPGSPAETPPLNKANIVSYIEETFGVPIRGKLTYSMAKKAGHYETGPGIIRLKRWGELEPAAHELAHHLEKPILADALLKAGKQGKAIREELKALDYKPDRGNVSEGYAEFMRHWLTTPDMVKEKAPLFAQRFDDYLRHIENAPLKKNLEELRGMYQQWYEQGASARVKGTIDFTGKLFNPDPTIRQRAQRFYDEWVHGGAPLDRMMKDYYKRTGNEPRGDANPAMIYNWIKGKSASQAHTAIMDFMPDEMGNPIGKGLKEILKPVLNNLEDFTVYAVAKRARERYQKHDLESGIDSADIRGILSVPNGTYDTVIAGLKTFSDQRLGWLKRAGVLSEMSLATIENFTDVYIPMMRAFKEANIPGGTGGKVAGTKKVFGSSRIIKDPIPVLMQQTEQIFNRAHRARLMGSLANLAESPGMGKYITKVPLKTVHETVTIEKLKSGLEDAGIEIEGADLDTVLTFFEKEAMARPTATKDGTVVVPIWRDGKLQNYEMAPDIFRAVSSLDAIDLKTLQEDPLFRIAQMPADLIKAGAVYYNPPFLLANMFRDTPDAFIASVENNPFRKIKNQVGGFVGTLRKSAAERTFEAMGGKMSTLAGSELRYHHLRDEMVARELGVKGVAYKVIADPVAGFQLLRKVRPIRLAAETWRGFSANFELPNRVAEFRSAMDKANREHPEWNELSKRIYAFNAAQDVTINFSRSGTKGKILNQYIPFFNPAVQGVSRFMHLMKERPASTSINAMLVFTVPALMSWWINKDKDWWKNIDDPAFKYGHLFIDGGDSLYRIPLAWEYGAVFAGLPVAALDSIYRENPKDATAFLTETLPHIFTPPLTPGIVGPLLDVKTNRNWKGRPIEPEWMRKNLKAEDIRKPATPEYAAAAAKYLNLIGFGPLLSRSKELSPIEAEYLINGHLGGFTRYFDESGYHPMKRFTVSNPDYPSRQLSNFYSALDRLNKGYDSEKLAEGKGGKDLQFDEGDITSAENQQRKAAVTFKKHVVDVYADKAKEAKAKGDKTAERQAYKDLTQKLNAFVNDKGEIVGTYSGGFPKKFKIDLGLRKIDLLRQ